MNINKGQSLYELVVAIGISALIMIAIVSLATNSIQNSSFSKNKALAATYAQQATEWLRGQRDSDINTFIGNTDGYAWCLPSLGWTMSTGDPVDDCTDKISGTIFSRWVIFPSGVQGGVVEADVVVSWTDSKGIHTVTNATNFSDWRQR